MTIANVFVHADKIVVCTDSAADFYTTDADGMSDKIGSWNISKIVTIPHWPGVIACRGPTTISSIIAGFALLMPDFDSLVDGFDASMAACRQQFETALPLARCSLDELSEIVLAGWSPKAGRLQCWHAVKPAGGQYELSEISVGVCAPPPFAGGAMPHAPTTVADHVAMARLQAERLRNEADAASGGDLVIATLTRDAITIELVRGFESPAQAFQGSVVVQSAGGFAA